MRRAIAMFAIALAVSVLGTAKSVNPAASANPRTGLIAFVGTATGTPELYTVRADGTAVQRLTDDGVKGPTRWSPDGNRLLVYTGSAGCPYWYCSPTGFSLMRPDGSDRLHIGGVGAAFSPNGNRLAYFVCAGTCDLYVSGANGRHRVRVDTDVWYDGVSSASWSSDSRHLVYVKQGVGGFDDLTVWVADRAGRERIRIPTDPPGSPSEPAFSPVFFPNDDTITFAREFFSPDIYSTSIADTAPTLRGHVGDDSGSLLESPTGTRLAVVGDTGGTGGHIRALNAAVDALGLFVTEFYASGPSSTGPRWSPDGSRIAYKFCRRTGPFLGGPCSIEVASPGGGHSTVYDGPAVEVPDWVRDYDWSPDSSKLVLSVSAEGGPFRLLTANADGSGLTPLLSGSDNQYMPAWQP